MKKRTVVKIADLFCGGGGSSNGARRACEQAGLRMELTAINHWDIALATHSQNFQNSRHLCSDLDGIDPSRLYRERELDIMLASPECRYHSTARGGRPIHDQARSTAFCVTRWADTLRPPVIIVENVPAFVNWGRLGSDNKPIPSQRGKIFRQWVKMLEVIGYKVEWRVLRSADYGDPTTRQRLFIYAVHGRRRQIIWPEPTHASPVEIREKHLKLKSWLTARDSIIDWSVKGKSIFSRKFPLSKKTMERIIIGLKRFGLRPFIVPQNQGGRPVHSIQEPLATVTCGSRGVLLAQPVIIQTAHGNGKMGRKGNRRRVISIDAPLPTVCGNRGDFAVCDTSFILGIDHRGGNGNYTRSVDDPLSTVTTKQRHALCEPFFVQYNGTADVQPISQPIPTLTTKARFGLVEVEWAGRRYQVDVLFRMLTWRELARAQGFPDDYQFTGNTTEIVRQIGGAVTTHLAEALVKTALKQL